MATSGSKSVTVTSYDTLKFSWSESSQSVANNKTTISWKMQLISGSAGYISSSASKDWKVVVNGTTYSGTNTVGISNNSTKTLASGTTTIAHNSDGTKTFSYSFAQEFGITFSGSSIGTKSGSGTGTLDTIPRASSVTATSVNVGSASTIKITRASSGFTHTLTYSFGSLSGTIATKTTSTSVSWTLPTSFYAQIGATATSKSGTITCTTYNGSTSIGSKTCTFTAKTSSSTSAPTLSPTVTDSNPITVALTGDSGKFIRYYSNASVSTGATARNSATLKSYKITCGSKSITTTSGTINAVESATFTFAATDSRKYTTTKTVTRTLIDYVKLTCSLSNDITVDGEATLKVSGNYFNGSFGATDNTLTVEYRYKTSSDDYSSWYSISPSLNGNTYSATTTVSGLDYRETYTFEARAIDKLATVTPDTKNVKALTVFDWGENDFNFNVPVHMINNASMFGTTTSGDSIENITPCNANNNCVIGYGGYDNEIGQTNVYGNKIMLGVKTANTLFKPYYEAGDSISGRWFGGGFATSGGKNLYFSIPLAKPVIGNPTITVTSVDGFMIRQGGKYLYGGTDSTFIHPSSFTSAVLEFGGSSIRIVATFNNATNVINNDACGIIADIKITFS